ncbi:DUF6962 family protein [Leptospira ilyithenensis]|uniref:Uncharacterized protein n=1 Tax=Leptospira ilyithenensis TaxID=2484901 RepID=A0A4R9LRY9_9LEPT|nr:hypothetical protein [Leptospira ilyithenensis]TGN14033.1 hypothetical protein EHS11_02915 [Leptospira ilyithenensis]
MQLSTFFSDFFLSIVSLYAAFRLNRLTSVSGIAGTYAFAIIGISAGLGSIHFLGISALDPIYRFFVGLSGYVGVVLIGVAYFHLGIRKLVRNQLFLIVGILFIVYIVFGYFVSFPILSTILGGISMLLVIFVCIRKISKEKTSAVYGLAGAALFILAGLVIGTKGFTGPILNVDLFHIGLAIANYCLGTSILKLK